MKKIIILMYTFLAIAFAGFTENFDLAGHIYCDGPPAPYSLTFKKENKINIQWDKEDGKNAYSQIYSYTKKYVGKFPMFVLEKEIPRNLWCGIDKNANFYYGNKFILLTGLTEAGREIGLALLPRRKREAPCNFFIRFPTGATGEPIISNYEKASSYLIENKIEYKIENLSNFDADTPWVEGVEGWGIGESFIIKTWDDEDDKHILLMNGYISAKNPNLYEENGRLKRVEVKGVKTGRKKEFTIKDTPHPQSIDISFLPSPEDVKITILDVYKGTKYQDTCLHYMVLWYSKVIPYE